jgi:predicted Zn-dependent peptidase
MHQIIFWKGVEALSVVNVLELDDGIRLTVIPDEKFKTIGISYCFHLELDHDYSYNALLPAVLKSGCEGLVTMQDINGYLDKQYGALFNAGVQKKGDCQIVRFSLDVVNEKYIDNEEAILAQGFHFINRLLVKPILVDGVFREEVVERERVNMINRINGIQNEKGLYSMERCIREMCGKERFSRLVYGSIDDLKELNPKRLVECYHKMVRNSPLDIIVIGDVDPEKIQKLIEVSLRLERRNVRKLKSEPFLKLRTRLKEVHEYMSGLAQGNLVVGCRTNIGFNDEDFPALLVYSSILGGGPYSRLFRSLRERENLAYHVNAGLEKHYGLLMIQAGIEPGSFSRAKLIVKQEMELLAKGKIDAPTYDQAMRDLVTHYRGVMDEPDQLADYYLSQSVSNSRVIIDEELERIMKVKPEDVRQVSRKIKLDTVYYLSSDRKGGNEWKRGNVH